MNLPELAKKPGDSKRRITHTTAVMCIEGEFVTWPQIAERTGLTEKVARSRMGRLDVVTWRGIARE